MLPDVGMHLFIHSSIHSYIYTFSPDEGNKWKYYILIDGDNDTYERQCNGTLMIDDDDDDDDIDDDDDDDDDNNKNNNNNK